MTDRSRRDRLTSSLSPAPQSSALAAASLPPATESRDSRSPRTPEQCQARQTSIWESRRERERGGGNWKIHVVRGEGSRHTCPWFPSEDSLPRPERDPGACVGRESRVCSSAREIGPSLFSELRVCRYTSDVREAVDIAVGHLRAQISGWDYCTLCRHRDKNTLT